MSANFTIERSHLEKKLFIRTFGAISNCFFSVCEVAVVWVDLFPACCRSETEVEDIWSGNATEIGKSPVFSLAPIRTSRCMLYISGKYANVHVARQFYCATSRRNTIYVLAFLIFAKRRFLVAKRYVTSIFMSYVFISKSYDCISIVRCVFKRKALPLLTICFFTYLFHLNMQLLLVTWFYLHFLYLQVY